MQETLDSRKFLILASLAALALAASFLGTLKFLERAERVPPLFARFESFNSTSDGPRLLFKGWSKPEHWGTWTDGAHAELNWLLDRRPASDVRVWLKGVIYPRNADISQAIRVVVNNTPVAMIERNFEGDLYGANFDIPKAVALARNPMRIEFVVANPTSPISIGDGEDSRKLGLGLQSLELVYPER